MKNKKRNILIISITVLVIAVLAVVIFNVSHAYFYIITYETSLNGIRTYTEDEQPFIVKVNIDENDDLSYLSDLSKCSGLETLNIRNQRIDSIEALNAINTSSRLVINIENSVINLEGINVSNVKELNITSSFVKGIKSIENLTSLINLKIDTISDYEDIDFSKLTNLQVLTLNGIYINDFDDFFNRIPTVLSLNLDNTNLNDDNIVNISKATKVYKFSCLYTNITNLEAFTSMNNLMYLYLPYTISDYSDLYNLNNLRRVEFSSNIDSDLYTELVDYMSERSIENVFYRMDNNLTDEQKIQMNQELDELVHKYEDVTEPEEGTFEHIQFIFEIGKDTTDLINKYATYQDNDFYIFDLLRSYGYENDIGYGIVLNNGRLSKKIFHIIHHENKYYYFISDDGSYEIANIYTDYDSYEGSRISFINPDIFVEPDPNVILDLQDYALKEDYIIGIPENTSIEELIDNLGSTYEVKIIDSNNKIKTSGLIATGDTIKIYDGNSVIRELTAVVKGDSTGDGIVNIGDLNKLYYHIQKIINMDGAYLESSELALNGTVDIGDLNKLYYYVLHLIDAL